MNQTLSQRGSLYLSMDETSYWNQQGRTRNWQFGYGSSINSVSYNLAVSRTQSDPMNGGSDTQLTASISLPLGGRSSSHRLSSNAISSSKGDSSLQSNVSGYLDDQATVSYSAQAGHSKETAAQQAPVWTGIPPSPSCVVATARAATTSISTWVLLVPCWCTAVESPLASRLAKPSA